MAPAPGAAAGKKGKKAWTGEKRKGPQPARHIPWPELFKHHMSSLEGHTRMLEMVQKHTIPESENARTIAPMVDRCHEMIRNFKLVSRIFVPAEDTFKTVPLGSSSETSYPGYHPGDYKYGEALQEAGLARLGAKRQGGSQQPVSESDARTESHDGLKRKRGESDKPGPTNGDGPQPTTAAAEAGNDTQTKDDSNPAEAGADNPYFVIDTNPTPVNIPQRLRSEDASAAASIPADSSEKRKSKKRKTDKATKEAPTSEFEDISGEVDARLKEKAERKQRKEEKKRKRESGELEDGNGTVSGPVGNVTGKANEAKRSKKDETEESNQSKPETKKDKKRKDAELQGEAESADVEAGKKKRRTRKGKEADADA